VDGKFHNKRQYYDVLMSRGNEDRPIAQKSIVPQNASIVASGLRTHTLFTLTAAPSTGFQRSSSDTTLSIRTIVKVSGTTFELNFLKLHLAYMALSFAP